MNVSFLEKSKLFIEDSKKEMLSKEYSVSMSKTSLADGEKPYRISIYEKFSRFCWKEVYKGCMGLVLVGKAVFFCF